MKHRSSYYNFRKPRKRRPFESRKSAPFIKLGIIFLAVAIVVAAVVIWVIPAIFPSEEKEDSIVLEEFRDPAQSTPAPGSTVAPGKLQVEAAIDYRTINDAYAADGKIVFGTASVRGGRTYFDKLICYYTASKSSIEIEADIKYDNIMHPRVSGRYIVWIDSAQAGGGRIMCYNTDTNERWLVKEFVYAMPDISVAGNYLVFNQQAGDNTDKLYVYDMSTRESACIAVNTGNSAPTSADISSDGQIIYANHYEIDGVYRSELIVYDIATGEETTIMPGKLVSAPKVHGDYVAFLSMSTGYSKDLYLGKKDELPSLVETDVLNMCMGDGWLAYTKDDDVYICPLDTRASYKINTDLSHGYLSAASDDYVCWYDITGGYDSIDVVKYAEIPENGQE